MVLEKNNEKKSVKLKIHGDVQGVFFRVEAREKARELGLVGFAKNESDETVLIEAEGPRQSLEKLIEWCNTGSSMAKVKKTHVEWGEWSGEYDDFEIRL